MRKRYKVVLNLEIDDPDDPFPAGGDYMHLTKVQGVIYSVTAYINSFGFQRVKYLFTLDKVIDKGEIEVEK